MKLILNNSKLVFNTRERIIVSTKNLINGGIGNEGNSQKVRTYYLDCSQYAGRSMTVYTDRPQSAGMAYTYRYEVAFNSNISLINTAANGITSSPTYIAKVAEKTTPTIIPSGAKVLTVCLVEAFNPTNVITLRKETFGDYSVGFEIID